MNILMDQELEFEEFKNSDYYKPIAFPITKISSVHGQDILSGMEGTFDFLPNEIESLNTLISTFYDKDVDEDGNHVLLLFDEEENEFSGGVLFFKNENHAEISFLEVSTDYRGKNVGKMILQFMTNIYGIEEFSGDIRDDISAHLFWAKFDKYVAEDLASNREICSFEFTQTKFL